MTLAGIENHTALLRASLVQPGMLPTGLSPKCFSQKMDPIKRLCVGQNDVELPTFRLLIWWTLEREHQLTKTLG